MTAATRIVPCQDTSATLPYSTAIAWQNKVNAEIAALWRYIAAPLTGVGGTANAVTATSDTSVVAAISAYATGQKFSITPTATNSGAVTIAIDGLSAKSVKDTDGTALPAGAWVSGRQYILEYDGTNFRKHDTSAPTVIGSAAPDMIVRDEKAANTAGGTFTSGAFQQRTLNTAVRNVISGASTGSNLFSLPAGTYYVEWEAPAYKVVKHQTRLLNATDATVVETGTTAYTAAADDVMSVSRGGAVFTLSTLKSFQIDHQSSATRATDGFGIAANVGAKEVYTWVNVWKVA